jgi:hypothetical protein
MSCAGDMLLGFSQWEGEKEGRPFGGARRMNAAKHFLEFRASAFFRRFDVNIFVGDREAI